MRGCVLFVDDEENILLAMRRLMVEWLEEQDCAMETAGSVAQALSLLEAEPERYRVVVSDLKMPHQIGTVLLKTVHERWPDTSTILLTGFAEMEEVKKAIKSGIVAFIQKPWDPDLVKAEVEKALELSNLRRKNREYLAAMVDEVNWARKIHHNILMGDSEGLGHSHIGIAYHPAQGLVEGGGDFFRLLRKDLDSPIVCLGTIDVHGAQGTYFALLVRDLLGTIVGDEAKVPSPGRLLESLNQRILAAKIALPGCFMSMTVCIPDAARATVSIASAGGESFFTISNNQVEEHHMPSPGLGYRDGILYQDRNLPFRPGNRLVLASRPLVTIPAIRERFLAALATRQHAGGLLDQAAEQLLAEVLPKEAMGVDATIMLLESPRS
jgi:sigma-B regulation protein RsbU (phosphoserine phosphatase)